MKAVATTCVGLALVLAGCTGGPRADAPPSRPPETPAAVVPSATPSEPDPVEPVPNRLRVALPDPAPALAGDGIVVDLAEAAAAPVLEEAPVARGMLLAQLNLFAADPDDGFTAGQPFLMTPTGEWRRLDLARYGLRSPAYGELSMALSADGRHVALSDPSGLVTLDLRDGSVDRFEPNVREAILVEWAADGATLLIKDRHAQRGPCGPQGCVLDLATGGLTPVPYDLFHSTLAPDGAVVELRTTEDGRSGTVTTHREGAEPARVPLRFRTHPGTAGGPEVARHLAYAQCGWRGTGGDPGVVVADPSSGRAVAMLVGPWRRECRLGARAWLSDRHLLVDDWRTGNLWLWDVPGGRVHRVGSSRTPGINYSVAPAVLAGRLGLSPSR